MNATPSKLPGASSLFREDNGTFSMTRLIVFVFALLFVAAVVFVGAFCLLYPDRVAVAWAALTGLLTVPGGAASLAGIGKVIQKFAEQKVVGPAGSDPDTVPLNEAGNVAEGLIAGGVGAAAVSEMIPAFTNSRLAAPPQHGENLTGDGTWPWTAEVEGEDIVVRGARATCFGGAADPQDNGETASGLNTKKDPALLGVSLPMDGRQFLRLNAAEHRALDGSPIPKVPFRSTMVRVTSPDGKKSFDFPVIDLGPGKRTGNALDLTVAAARKFKPTASATNFELRCDYRILGGAQFA